MGFSSQLSICECLSKKNHNRSCTQSKEKWQETQSSALHHSIILSRFLCMWVHYHFTLYIILLCSSTSFFLLLQKFPAEGHNLNTWKMNMLKSLQIQCLKHSSHQSFVQNFTLCKGDKGIHRFSQVLLKTILCIVSM